MKSIKEVDVSKPVESYLEKLGYKVRSEVKSCDITGTKDDELVVVECKKSLSLKLIYQGVDRQEFCDNVYLAVPLIDGKKLPNRKNLLRLLRRLELGLILVVFLKTKTRVEVVLEPKEHKRRKKHKKKGSILKEIESRSGNYNRGGSVKKMIMTGYKEESLEIARLISENGKLSSSELKKMGTGVKTYSILYNNFYGWFVKEEERGKYGISEKGILALKEFQPLLNK